MQRRILLALDSLGILDGPVLSGQEVVIARGSLVIALSVPETCAKTLADQSLGNIAA